jgi:hypothetical protein
MDSDYLYLIKILELHSGYDIETIERILQEKYVKDDILIGRKIIAAYLGVSERVLSRWKIDGLLPACVKIKESKGNKHNVWSAHRRALLQYIKEQM